mgnify:FL=1|jgi:hypothetical protein|tara:strand:- start:1100 stop:1402 length:303 start_codon:yes stop_codon:yes gene_type:complete
MGLDEKQIAKKIINNKTIHFELQGNVHKKLRALLFLKELSMQKFFRLVSETFIDGDEYLNKLVENKVKDNKNKVITRLKNIDTKDLYNAIEENSPLKEEN